GFFEDISFTVHKDEKIGFLCSNSLSLEMLFNVISGEMSADSGEILFGKTITTSYLPQNNAKYFEHCDLPLVEWLSQYSSDHHEEFLRGWLGKMLFSGDEALKSARVISGGEKVRCMLSRMMLQGSNFLILDEPTNHLDLEAITALNKGMINFKGNILFSTHDHEITQTVANRIIEIEKGKIIYDKLTTYDEYLDTLVE
ncbi:MAG: ATP-binding cassette domain-containing protein, partial [Clostridia bacterium]